MATNPLPEKAIEELKELCKKKLGKEFNSQQVERIARDYLDLLLILLKKADKSVYKVDNISSCNILQAEESEKTTYEQNKHTIYKKIR